ncbi:hypothetical protein [Paenibacillus odorifer]|uniref:Uncharacterized protein n=1 Tax=Paenibacillus odorifer TaxID=189426 RepID=A0AAD0P449_9BACL|nr:hypothetical protein [Paenibacillus odorifer]AWV34934.1 hypothetical protein CD191_21150 [Paenibacillus odorifer]
MSISFKYLEEDGKRLADYGWTIPGDLTPLEVHNLANANDRAEVDLFFEQHYAHDINLFKMCNSIYSAEIYSNWRKLIDECIFCFRSEKYLVAIPSLISIIDGALAQIGGTSGIRIKGLCLEQAQKQTGGSVKYYFWLSVYNFISNLFSKSDFNDPKPQFLNRNWILHGRSVAEWEKTDCLRLMQTLDTLVTATKSRGIRSYLEKWKEDSKLIER